MNQWGVFNDDVKNHDWNGGLIQIQVNNNTSILCKAAPGISVGDANWQISQVVLSTDSVFSGLPYQRTTWAVNPISGLASTDFIFKATDALTLNFA